MKKLLFGALVLLCAVPAGASAASVAAGKQVMLPRGESVVENFHAAGGRVSIAGQVEGDLTAAGGNVVITGDVLDDVLAAGGTVSILGTVGGDVRVMGGQLTVGNDVGGDLLAAGGSVHILSDAVVQGDLYVAGGDVILDGVVSGNVRMVGGRLTLNGTVTGDVSARLGKELTVGSEALVGGQLDYRAPRAALIPEFAQIDGSITFEPSHRTGTKASVALLAVAALVSSLKFLALLGFSVFLVAAWHSWAERTVREVSGAFLPSAGRGLVIFIVVPVAVALLLMSFVGALAGLTALAGYAALLLVVRGFVGVLAGALLARYVFRRPSLQVNVPWTIAGVVALQVLDLIPVLGWLATGVLCLAVLGVLSRDILLKLHIKS